MADVVIGVPEGATLVIPRFKLYSRIVLVFPVRSLSWDTVWRWRRHWGYPHIKRVSHRAARVFLRRPYTPYGGRNLGPRYSRRRWR